MLLIFVYVYSLAQSPAGILIIKAINGDTIVIAGGKKVRLVGIDTLGIYHPNKKVECFTKEAKLFTESQVLNKLLN